MSNGPETPRRPLLPSVSSEPNGNGHDNRSDDDSKHRPRGPLQIAADCAMEAKEAALQASGWAGEALGAANAAKRASDQAVVELAGLRADVAGLRRDVSEVARALGAKRSFSGTLAIPSPVSTPQALQIRTSPSPTGEHQRIAESEIERLAAQFDDVNRRLQDAELRATVAEAEERGAREAVEALEAEKAKAEKVAEAERARSKDLREKALAALAFAVPAAAVITWFLAHYH